jgi:hypothetical protein
MVLQDIIGDLENLDASLTICVARTPVWTALSESELHPASRVTKRSPAPYFLEVAVAKDVLRAWSYARCGRVPSLEQKCEALIYYAKHDACLLPGDEREP